MSPDVLVERLPYGRRTVEITIPRRDYLGTLAPRARSGGADPPTEVVRALEHPIGRGRLRDIARSKHTALIVVDDITRRAAAHIPLPPLLGELSASGLSADQVTLLVATGTHRDRTRDELEGLLGTSSPDGRVHRR